MSNIIALFHAYREAERSFALAVNFKVGAVMLADRARRRRRARRDLVLALASRDDHQALVGDTVITLDPTTHALSTRREGVALC